MRHMKTGRKLNRAPAHRQALVRHLASALFLEEAIITTKPKAKEAQRFAERLITVAKRGHARGNTLAARRLTAARLRRDDVAKKLCEDIAPRFAGREGGYTRILKLVGVRKGDAAMRVRLELTEIREKPKEKDEKKKK